jgi:molybdenum cofactor cytidylyltransferase
MISAIILAAGESKRMGQPKMLLRWGRVTVLEHVISVFMQARIKDILVVVGAEQERLEGITSKFPIRSVYNRDYANGEMLSSLQCGLRDLLTLQPPMETIATLIGLGDQPQVQEGIVRSICDAYENTNARLIVPSFQMKRGHPWLVAQPFWNELLDMKSPKTPRDFLNKHAHEIHYVETNTASILADLDTPEDYFSANL